jgi:cytochrome c oxidase subunit 1
MTTPGFIALRAFANGFIALTTARGLGRRLNDALLHAAFWTLFIGSLLAVCAMFSGKAVVPQNLNPRVGAAKGGRGASSRSG